MLHLHVMFIWTIIQFLWTLVKCIVVILDYNEVYYWYYDVHMEQMLKKRAESFSRFVSEEVRGAIAAKGFTQRRVATKLRRQPKNLSQWLSGERQIPMDVAYQICDIINMDIQTIVARADEDVVKACGPWPPLNTPDIDYVSMSEEERKAFALQEARQAGFDLIADRDGNKEEERNHFADEGA